MRKIIVMGPPGSGKSTAGHVVAARMGLTYISSGDIARSMGTPPGQMAEETAMRAQIKSAIDGCCWSGFVLDGFPRTLEQAILLSHWIGKYDIVCLVVNTDVAISRLLGRGRADDDLNTIIHRLDHYYTTTHQIVNAACHGLLNQRVTIMKPEISNTAEEIAGRIAGLCWDYRREDKCV